MAVSRIKGKQIGNQTIAQNNISITTASITTSTSVTTKEYVDNAINSGLTNFTYSNSDINITANATSGSTPVLACARTITDVPQGGVKVFVNTIEVDEGPGLDCFFSSDGGVTPKAFGSEAQGDHLYWNAGVAPFQLDTLDSISYMYLVYTVVA